MLIDFMVFSCNHLSAAQWSGQHSLLQGEPTAQGSVTGAQPCAAGRAAQPTHCPWAHTGTASSCLLPTHASGQEGPCRIRRYQCTDLLCFNSAHSSCGTRTATPSPTAEQKSQHRAMPSWWSPKNLSAGELLLLWNCKDPSGEAIQLGLVNI